MNAFVHRIVVASDAVHWVRRKDLKLLSGTEGYILKVLLIKVKATICSLAARSIRARLRRKHRSAFHRARHEILTHPCIDHIECPNGVETDPKYRSFILL
jgi:hypothetical protein